MASVRMGEMHTSSASGDELVAIGLGSCIGLALLDCSTGIAGLAHVVLPDSGNASGPAGKFADLAIPEMLTHLQRAGAHRERLEAVIVGGAKMFALGAGMDIGARNEAAVKAQLSRHRIRLRASATGGSSGRTMRVFAKQGLVNVHEAGGKPVALFGGEGQGAGARTSARARTALRVAGAEA